MRAVVLDTYGQPVVADVPAPAPAAAVLACGLCGSDVEKLGTAPEGTVLGHEVVALVDGRRLALIHHGSCGDCERCRTGHESTCEHFAEPTIVPGRFAEAVRAAAGVEVHKSVDDAVGSYVEPLACVLRALERLPRGRVLVVGCGFVGRLFVEILRLRGDVVFALEPRGDRRCAPEPDEPVDAAVLCAPAGGDDALARLEPGGTLLVFSPGGVVDLVVAYRRILVLQCSTSANRRQMGASA